MTVVLVYRDKRPGAYSIEQLFRAVAGELSNDIEVIEYETHGLGRILSDVLAVRKLRADVYHVTGDIHYFALFLPHRRTMLTIHDLGHFLRTLSGVKKWLYKWLWLMLPIRCAGHVTAISERTRHDIQQVLEIDRTVTVVPNCYPSHFKLRCPAMTNRVPRILQVGASSHKNLHRVIDAVKGIECSLVILGRPDDSMHACLARSGITYEIHSDLTPHELVEQYNRADIVCFVSLYEGFGLPIIEAQVIGRPVITSCHSPMADVARDSACLVDPYDVKDIRRAIERLLKDEAYRTGLIQKGFENVVRYSPTSIAKQYLDLYNGLANLRPYHG